MNIIKPCHNKPASLVENWKQIKDEAKALREFIHEGKFEGNYKKAYAISHAQVSEEPKHFFVVHNDFKKAFGSWCIINLTLAPKGNEPACRDPGDWNEACMSFPHREPKRTERFNKMRVSYKVPFLWGWRTVTRDLTGISAFISQHEAMHAAGKNIYGLE